jgi:hypothetical protein
MRQGAHTPEELESLLEDAFVLRDRAALPPLFEADALLAAGSSMDEARGCQVIARSASELWTHGGTYVAEPRRVLQTADVALVLATDGTSVVRRGADGIWRYAILLLSVNEQTRKEEKR